MPDNAETPLLSACRVEFQPDDRDGPAVGTIPHEIERLGHLLAGISSTIAVLLSDDDLWGRARS